MKGSANPSLLLGGQVGQKGMGTGSDEDTERGMGERVEEWSGVDKEKGWETMGLEGKWGTAEMGVMRFGMGGGGIGKMRNGRDREWRGSIGDHRGTDWEWKGGNGD